LNSARIRCRSLSELTVTASAAVARPLRGVHVLWALAIEARVLYHFADQREGIVARFGI